MKQKLILTLAMIACGPLLADPGTSLRETAAAKSTQTPVVQGAGGWLYLPAELNHIAAGKFWGPEAGKVSKATKPENADPLPAILDFKSQLDKAGVELILVPVPSKAFVYPEPLSGKEPAAVAPERMDEFHQQFFAELRKNGITVVDLLPDLLAQRGKDQMYCKTDTHWSGMATVLAAEKIAALLKDKAWIKDAPQLKTTADVREVEIKGDLARMQDESKPVGETLKLSFIKDASGAAVASDPKSPLILLGDSHTLVFNSGGDMLASGAGLADQLAHDLGIAVDLIGVRGSGATPARINLMRKVRGDEAYLKGKKAVVWCFTVREFTESSGWSKVPIVKE
jgi:alginate O-acetyltransferase complex protein AlgJ